MAGLLVSVRSAAEARAAGAGGAAVIDVKEPARGPLGRADVDVWAAVRQVVPAATPVSVALGELGEWAGAGPVPEAAFAGLAYRKLGLAGAGPDWASAWSHLIEASPGGPAWVAVAYADWNHARAPHPDAVLDRALTLGCAGVLLDTWGKGGPSPVGLAFAPWVERARRAGRFVALAGGLGEADIVRLAPLRPDLFAVRGAACAGGDRRGRVDPERVARLARTVRTLDGSEPARSFP